ncbi:histone deacetylase [Streptomyces sp. Y1]|uniref:Histone deacetylase n=1 Tax=Streptomyces sp. Y1 TaxID=3238634 RepID=A0AB39TXK0_9ACTN
MNPDRLARYLRGGRPPGAALAHPGCRDPRPPRRRTTTTLPGTLYFATTSTLWGGGRAFYDPHAPGWTACAAYLITAGQFSDIAAQEMRRSPGRDLDLGPVLATGRHRLGPGRYETLLRPGDLDGHPLLTFTAPWDLAGAAALLNPPSPAYLRNIATALVRVHRWGPWRTAAYLATRPGAAPCWTTSTVCDALGPP